MNPGASLFHWPPHHLRDHNGTARAVAVAVLFIALAAASFALDQSLTLSGLPGR